MSRLAQYRKFIAALASVLATAIATGVLTGEALRYTTIASTVVGAILVYLLENAPAEVPEA